MTTAVDVANQALQLIAARATLTGTLPTFDGSPLGMQVGILYTQVRDTLLREQDFEFSRLTGGLASAVGYNLVSNAVDLDANNSSPILANTGLPILVSFTTGQGSAIELTPIYPWQYAYYYPADCVRIRSIVPCTWNMFDPQPVRWSEMQQWVIGSPTRVIMCNVYNAQITYSSNAISESEWDPGYTQTFIRFLASELAMAVGGRPDFSKVLLQQAGSMIRSAGGRDS